MLLVPYWQIKNGVEIINSITECSIEIVQTFARLMIISGEVITFWQILIDGEGSAGRNREGEVNLQGNIKISRRYTYLKLLGARVEEYQSAAVGIIIVIFLM